jgi:DNA-binding Lrp family transcriptional regulator
MVDPVPAAAEAVHDLEIVRARLLSRLALALLLDLVDIARGDAHVLDALLASAIIQANIQEIMRRADLQLEFAREETVPPDEMRRPVSMNALATSLKLPFETVRRRVTRMADAGFCRFVDGGVIVPTAVLGEPRYYVDGFRGYERIRGFYYQAADLGLIADLPPATVDLSKGAFPIRAVSRLVGVYVLRVAEKMGAIGDVLDSLIALEVCRCNVEALPAEACAEGDAAPDGVACDAERAPVSINQLARRLGVPGETVRRHARRLIERGIVRREATGLIVPAEALAGPALGPALADNTLQLQRLLASLSQLGVLKVWDGVRPAGVAAER